MNRQLDFDRTFEEWLAEGPSQLSDNTIEDIVSRLHRTKQRRPGWLPRRNDMNRTFVALGGVAAAAVVVVIVGVLALGLNAERPGVGAEPTPSPTTIATAQPTVEPTAEPTPTATPRPTRTPQGLLPEGPFVLWTEGVPMTVTIPAPDWYGEPGDGILIKNDQSGAPDGAGMIVFVGDLYVYGDPCQWATTRPDTPATTIDELVAALTAQASRDATEPVDVTVDGYAGKSITLHVPEDADFSECDRGTFGSWGVPGSDLTPHRYHQDPGQIDKLWILDVDGELVVLDIAYYEETPQDVVDQMHAIVESATFEAP